MKYISKLRVKQLLKQYSKEYPEHCKIFYQMYRDINELTEVSFFDVIACTIIIIMLLLLIIAIIIKPEYFITTWR